MEPAGIIMPFAGTVAPQGCLFCDGSAVSRTTYAALFAVIGTTYGAGDGSTTFNIPDLSGRVVIGVSNSHALGTTGGSETVTLTADQLPSHVHEVPQHGHENDIAAKTPVLTHSITQPSYKYNKPNPRKSGGSSPLTQITSTSTQTASQTTNVSITEHSSADCTKGGSVTAHLSFNSGSYGGGAGHNNMQPYTAVNYVICTGGMMNTGSIVMFAGSVAPQGWLLCDGTAVSRSTYSALFDVLGTYYGAGDESTTFNIPDLKGRVVIGSSQNYPSASTGGEEAHVLTEQEIPSHSHVVGQHGHANNFTFATPALSHTITQAVFKYNANGSTGGRGGNNNGSSNTFYGTTSTYATRSASAAVDDHASANCALSGSITDCAAFDTESTGIDYEHDNMQPYITLNYIIYTGV